MEHAPGAQHPQVLDRSRLDGLSVDLGDRAATYEVVRSFLVQLPGRLTELDEAVRDGDAETGRRVAHTVKSTAMLLGADALAEAALAAETGQGSAGDVRAAAAPAARELRLWMARG